MCLPHILSPQNTHWELFKTDKIPFLCGKTLVVVCLKIKEAREWITPHLPRKKGLKGEIGGTKRGEGERGGKTEKEGKKTPLVIWGFKVAFHWEGLKNKTIDIYLDRQKACSYASIWKLAFFDTFTVYLISRHRYRSIYMRLLHTRSLSHLDSIPSVLPSAVPSLRRGHSLCFLGK